jgi:hypothetical protein
MLNGDTQKVCFLVTIRTSNPIPLRFRFEIDSCCDQCFFSLPTWTE